MITIQFERETKYGVYRDAITLPDDHTLTDTQIQAMMQQRADDWVAYVDNPPAPATELKPETIEVDGVKYQKVD